MAKWVFNNVRKEDPMQVLFSDEKVCDADGIYNPQTQRIWTGSIVETNEEDGSKMK